MIRRISLGLLGVCISCSPPVQTVPRILMPQRTPVEEQIHQNLRLVAGVRVGTTEIYTDDNGRFWKDGYFVEFDHPEAMAQARKDADTNRDRQVTVKEATDLADKVIFQGVDAHKTWRRIVDPEKVSEYEDLVKTMPDLPRRWCFEVERQDDADCSWKKYDEERRCGDETYKKVRIVQDQKMDAEDGCLRGILYGGNPKTCLAKVESEYELKVKVIYDEGEQRCKSEANQHLHQCEETARVKREQCVRAAQ